MIKRLVDRFTSWSSILAVVFGSVLLIGLEIVEEPELTLGEILLELIQPTLIVLIAVSVVRLTDRVQRQYEEQKLSLRAKESEAKAGSPRKG